MLRARAALALLLAVSAHAAPLAAELRPEVVDALRGGGHVIFLRHGATDRSRDDAPNPVLDDCATQRNLSAAGRAQATAIGAALRGLGVPIGEVVSSPFCRCHETARLAFGRVALDPRLRGLTGASDAERAERIAALRARLSAAPASGNAVIVSHSDNYQEVVGHEIAEGGAAIVAPNGGGFKVVAEIDADSWSVPGGSKPPADVPRRIPEPVAAAVASPDRTEADRALDAGRKPADTLAFFGIAPGQRVAELFAAGGYTTELLARVVGPKGVVFGQNNRVVLERFASAPWAERLARPAMASVVRVDRELDDPLPPQARQLDAVLFVLAYHDSVWLGTDRAAMNRTVFAALRSGGVYGIVDHSAEPGSGLRDVQTLHRIDETQLVAEILAAGFRLDSSADFLRNPADPRDWNDSPTAAGTRRGTSDRFVLRFVKP